MDSAIFAAVSDMQLDAKVCGYATSAIRHVRETWCPRGRNVRTLLSGRGLELDHQLGWYPAAVQRLVSHLFHLSLRSLLEGQRARR